MACPLQAENIWVQKNLYSEAEKNYFVHLSKLLNGPGAKQPKSNQVKPEKVVGSNETPKQKAAVASDASSQNVATSLPTDTKKEKEKKNKRINKNKDAVAGRTASNESNADVKQNVQFRKAAPSPPKVSTESKDFKSESPNNAQTAAPVAVKKPKKDRWRNRRNKNNNSKEEEHMREGSNQTLNAQDEKKVGSGANQGTLVSEIAKARQHIKNSLERMDGIAALAAASPGGDVLQRLATLENENKNLVELTNLLKKTLGETQNRVQVLEDRLKTLTISGAPAAAKQNGVAAAPAPKPEAKDDDDDVDLFGSDSEGEDAEAAKVREQRLAEYAAKKSKKPVLIAKSSVVLDIKPWDDETDLNKMEEVVRKITTDGLLWGASKFVPVAFGIKKLSISCVVEDDKVSIDWLTEQIEQNEDFVQSVDVAAFNKI